MTASVAPLTSPTLFHLINKWGEEPRRAAGEADDPYPALASIAAGLPPGSRLDEDVAVEAADRLHAVFATEDPDTRAEALNELIADTGLRFGLVARDGALHEQWSTERPDRALLAAGTLAMLALVSEHPDSERLGVCAGDDCVDAYVDRSPATRRRYCSITCQNRARTRRHRAHR